MKFLSLVLPSLNPPGWAFTGSANAADQVPPESRPMRVFLPISLEISPRGARGTFFRPWRPPRALSESSWRGSRAQEAAKALPEASGVDFWRHFGSQNGALFGFFRASVAWCFSLAFGQFFVRLSFCLKDVRAPRANGAHADYIVKTNGFKHIFKLCFRAGECRGQQNTHGSGKKTHAKTAPKKQTVW